MTGVAGVVRRTIRRGTIFICGIAFACSPSSNLDVPSGSTSNAGEAPIRSQATRSTDVALALAESTYYRSELDSTRALLRAAMGEADASGDSATRARALTWLGLVEYKQSNFASARALGEDALALKLRLHLTRDLPRSFNALGLIAYYEGRYDDALRLFTAARDTARVVRDSMAIARTNLNFALVWTDRGELAKARSAMEQAGTVLLAGGDRRAAANALANLGMANIRVGDPTAALRVLQAARVVYDTLSYAPGQEMALGQMAEAYGAAGDPRLAFAYGDSALAIARRYGLRQQEVDGLRYKASLYFESGDLPRSLEYFENARTLAGTLGLSEVIAEIAREEARVLDALGETSRAEARATEALIAHRNAGAQFEQLVDRLLVAELAHRAGHAAAAEQSLRLARQERDAFPVGIGRVLVALTEARVADADADPHQVLLALRPIESDLVRVGPPLVAEAFALRARAQARLGRFDDAARDGRRSIASLELVRRRLGTSALGTTFVASKARVYGDLVLVLLRLGRVDEALEVADAVRGRALLEYLASSRSDVDSVARDPLVRGEELLNRIDDLISRLADADSIARHERGPASSTSAADGTLVELVSARREYEELVMRAAESDARASALLGATRLSALAVRRSLARDEALVEYLSTGDRLLTFVVRRDGLTVIDTTAAPAAIAARVRLARDVIARPAMLTSTPVLSALNDLLIAPVERRGALRGIRTIIVVPHGALSYLPFGALRDSGSGSFLVQRYAFVTVPSANALVALRRGAKAAGTPPNVSAAVLAPAPGALPGTVDEAREVARVVGARILMGREATERALRTALERNTIVHVAGHAVLNAYSPLFSRLELVRGSSTPTDDGRFELHELLGARIGSPLVFLSGCDTGLGNAWSTAYARGEDFSTIGQAFLQAGASNVVATLWRIEDRAAAVFASEFYRALRTGPPATALAAAQRALLASREYSAPYYWAAYQLEGAGDGLTLDRKSP